MRPDPFLPGGLDPQDARNQALLAEVRPDDWKEPVPAGRYNLVVLGAGPAGLVAAAGAAGLGAKVALVEKHLMGGDCLNVGCVPSKTLLRAAKAAHEARQAVRFGIKVAQVEVDFSAAMERVRRVRADLAPHDSARRYQQLGVDVYLGPGRFSSRDSIEVNGKTLHFAKAVIATGARAASLPIPGLVEVGYLTNETLFELTALPSRLAIIGSGPIGCEMAQAFARLGSRVTVIEAGARILGREDPQAAGVVQRRLEAEGVRFELGVQTERVARTEGTRRLDLTRGTERWSVSADVILVAAGRAPNVEGLELEKADVAYGRRGVLVDDTLRTSNPKVYAAGDVCQTFKFTHAADFAARLVLQNALFPGFKKRFSRLQIPWCTYTDPEVAHVGLYEHESEIPIDTYHVPLSSNDRWVTEADAEGFIKVHAAKGTGRILGATVVGAHAGDMIGELCLALRAGVGLGTLASAIHPYPTQAEAIRKVGDLYQRTRLTPVVAGLFKTWLRWTR